MNVQPWWKETTNAQWREAGFGKRPSYRNAKRRFKELAEREDALLDAIAHIIAIANEHEHGWIGHDLWFDATEAEDNVRLHHDCREDEPCARRARAEARKLARKGPLPPAPPQTLQRASALDVHRERHAQADREIDDEATGPEDGVLVLSASDEHEAEDVRLVRDSGREQARLRVGGCWYRLRDPDAGVRAYTNEDGAWKFWIGFFNHKAVCKYSGLRVAELVRSASEQEANAYPVMIEERVCRVLGRYPR